MMTNEINWAAPVVGKLEVGKTYVNRMGHNHTYTGRAYVNVDGRFHQDTNQRHVLDLIAEYTPPAPLKMWMNAFEHTNVACVYESEQVAKDSGHCFTRIAVPVTITEGH